MRAFKYVIVAISVAGCSSQGGRFEYGKSSNPWIDAYKDHAFFECIRQSYGDSIFRQIIRKDALNPYDGISADALVKANSNGAAIARNIPPPAMCEDCSAEQNYYLATCLHYYKSFELDSIAKAQYAKFQKETRERR